MVVYDSQHMDEQGFKDWLDGQVKPHAVRDLLSLCKQIESVLPSSEFGSLDEVVDGPKFDDAIAWLKDNAEAYIRKGQLTGAKNRVWALKKYKKFRDSQVESKEHRS